jgi:hypothetical protein
MKSNVLSLVLFDKTQDEMVNGLAKLFISANGGLILLHCSVLDFGITADFEKKI